MGSATVYVIGPLVVYTNTKLQPDPNELRDRIMYMLYVCTYKYKYMFKYKYVYIVFRPSTRSLFNVKPNYILFPHCRKLATAVPRFPAGHFPPPFAYKSYCLSCAIHVRGEQ